MKRRAASLAAVAFGTCGQRDPGAEEAAVLAVRLALQRPVLVLDGRSLAIDRPQGAAAHADNRWQVGRSRGHPGLCLRHRLGRHVWNATRPLRGNGADALAGAVRCCACAGKSVDMEPAKPSPTAEETWFSMNSDHSLSGRRVLDSAAAKERALDACATDGGISASLRSARLWRAVASWFKANRSGPRSARSSVRRLQQPAPRHRPAWDSSSGASYRRESAVSRDARQ